MKNLARNDFQCLPFNVGKGDDDDYCTTLVHIVFPNGCHKDVEKLAWRTRDLFFFRRVPRQVKTAIKLSEYFFANAKIKNNDLGVLIHCGNLSTCVATKFKQILYGEFFFFMVFLYKL